ncbi:glutamine synthetase family protein [Tropicibacter naphthalenivorans]|uniref:Glutamine synthetase n=1 Tax=Tropicibacter naphthalenivorans TaxID=441103 RepID=A0A0P1G1C5_9RHOB|nr:glutamine synthetase family protein [Tropicibacter naphthalenivorans]CUH75586.1 Glutamine synthetase [Tropicibacter naphthalenivorans]SMC43347.1 L-glutamine synthetase [Tropicibacter naphthalenivorans]
MTQTLSLADLKQQVETGAIDTVLVCLVDMQGRLMGKRMHAAAFLEMAQSKTHCCSYLLATDLVMATSEGFAATNWQTGYGDYVMKPDLGTLRPVPWAEGTVLVLCDVLHDDGRPVAHSPRQMLQAQIARAEAMGLTPIMATELEFYLFQGTADQHRGGFETLQPITSTNSDYAILGTAQDEPVMRPVRNHLRRMGVPVEGSKGEADAGQEELNITHAGALACADHHTLAKHAIKEIARQQGLTASFLAKWHPDRSGSSAHVHQSLMRGGQNVFFEADQPLGKSALMDHYMAGLLKYARDTTLFMAPYINSYKRFTPGTFAPTRIVWAVDNRTSAYRLCGAGTRGVRVECRLPGADMNPYLAQAALLAAGLRGIEEKLTLDAPFEGDGYAGEDARIPTTLTEARAALLGSDMMRAAFGDAVVTHYARVAEWELETFERAVTDWEIARGLERA